MLTRKDDEEMYTWLEGYWGSHGYAPSIRELADGMGVNTAAARNRLKRLIKLGWVRKVPRTARGLVLTR